MSSFSKTQQVAYDILCQMSGRDATNTLTDYLGSQILTDAFAHFLVDEGLASESDFSDLFNEDEEDEGYEDE